MKLTTKLARLAALTALTATSALVAAAAQAAPDPAGQPVNGMPEVPNPPMHQVPAPNTGSQATQPQTTPQGGMGNMQQQRNTPAAPTTRSTPWSGRYYQGQQGAAGTTATPSTTHHKTTHHRHHKTHHGAGHNAATTPGADSTSVPNTEPTTPH